MLQHYMTRELQKYYQIVSGGDIPDFFNLYLMTDSLRRLEGIDYFCGVYYHKIQTQNPKVWTSRLDHSIDCGLTTWHFTKNRQAAICALLHDIGTPTFSHSVDFGLNDAVKQESGEWSMRRKIETDPMLKELLFLDGIDIATFDSKNYSLVENPRPGLCVDRISGVLLSGLFWSQTTDLKEVKEIYQNLVVLPNEQGKLEFGFTNLDLARRFFDLSSSVTNLCHAKENRLALSLLGDIICYGVKSGLFTMEELHTLTEQDVIDRMEASKNPHMKHYFHTYCNLTEVYESVEKPNYYCSNIPVKKRVIDPLVMDENLGTVRLSQIDSVVKESLQDLDGVSPVSYAYVKLKWNGVQKRKF